MALFKKKEKKNHNYLEMTPKVNYGYEINEKGLIDVLVPKFTDKFLSKFLMPRIRNPHIKANLDEIGTATWLLIDGNNKVDFIIERLNEKFGDKLEPSIERVLTFLSHLYRNGFITFLEL